LLNADLKTTVTTPIKRRKNRIKFLGDFLKNASALNQNEECHCIINESDFVSAFSSSEKVPLLDIKSTTQIVFKPSKGIFWFKGFHFELTLILFFLTTFNGLGQTTITQWNFDASNLTPSTGSGTASNVGGTSSAFASGPPNSGQGWNTSLYPAISSNSGTAGVQFAVSTVGFQNIQLTFDHRASGTASRWARVDYSLNGGSNWTTNFWNNNGGLSPHDNFYSFTVDFSSVSGANNNVNFVVRIVSIFSPDAFSDGLGNYYSASSAYYRARISGGSVYASTGTWRFDNVTLSGSCSCSTPTTLSFTTQPNNVFQNTPMTHSVQVAATCSNGTISTCYNGTVTLTVNSPGCGYTSQTVNFVNGVATFSNIIFLRSPQTNLTFTATSSGLTSVTSNPFNVNAPTGAPTVTTITQNNFDANLNWSYSVGADIDYGGTGSGSTPAPQGVGVVGIYNFTGNNVLRKSYSVDNASGEFGCSNTITFSNVPSLSIYNIVDFSFNLLSFGIGTCGTTDGCGVESSEEFVMQVSTDGGTNWNTILTKKGFNNCLFGITSSPITSLSIGSSPVYTTGSCDTKSAFTLSMSGISQFQFRFTANNNRSEENWAIDNIKLTGTNYGVGAPFNLPTVNLGPDLNFCSGNSQELSASVTSFQPDLSYSWSPVTGLSASNISNPVVSGLSAAQTYTLTVTDGHGCNASDQVEVTPKFPPSIISISPP
jgi:hypothetical protein